ncbi:helix-turn-helix transcriptional regulator [bacterium]|nr:helix-turn-helix transcriptional regulator [bacterium]
MDNIYRIFSNKIKELRKARNFSQEEYANFIGINLKTLSNIERGNRSIHLSTISKIVNAEKIPVYKLFMTKEEQKVTSKNELFLLINKLNDNEIKVIKNLIEIIIS